VSVSDVFPLPRDHCPQQSDFAGEVVKVLAHVVRTDGRGGWCIHGLPQDEANLTVQVEVRCRILHSPSNIAPGVAAGREKRPSRGLSTIEGEVLGTRFIKNLLALRLPAALEQRAEQWKADLRAEPHVARLVLRRLVGPLTLWDEDVVGKRPDSVKWEAEPKADLLAGLAPTLLDTSPAGFEPAS
jgi:hypothetical protein